VANTAAGLHGLFEQHKSLALRHAEEREMIAAELVACAKELLASADARIAQFEEGSDDLQSSLP